MCGSTSNDFSFFNLFQNTYLRLLVNPTLATRDLSIDANFLSIQWIGSSPPIY